jgi:peptidoglycan hydrolase-like protein with peptidoglycan-binding domain
MSRGIADIQRRLVDLGYDPGAADGLFGPRTRAAIRAFQADRGLPATGRPDGTTLQALFAAVPPATPADKRAPADDPPSLEAVPLRPVQVTPLAPLAGSDPPEGGTAGFALAIRPSETRPSSRTERGVPRSPTQAAAEPEPPGHWLEWAAGALAMLGVFLLAMAARRKAVRRDAAAGRLPAPGPPEHPAPTTTLNRGHVFGVEVPPAGDSGRG